MDGSLADAENGDLSGTQVKLGAIAGLVNRLGEQKFPAHPIVDLELRGDAPLVLCVEEPTPLALACIGAGTDVAAEPGDFTEQERGVAQTLLGRGTATGDEAGVIRAEVELAGAVAVAGHSKVQGVTDIGA